MMEGPWCRFRREARARERPRHCMVDSLKALDPKRPIREADVGADMPGGPLSADFVAKVCCRLVATVIPSLGQDSLRRLAMMGRLEHGQEHLFYEFRLDEVVPDDHLVRGIAGVLDLSWVRGELASYYSPLGRPSIDPLLMIRMLIVGYAFGIRSERLLCREVQVNLAYRWFCGLSIEDKIPDHSAFSRARNERFRDSA